MNIINSQIKFFEEMEENILHSSKAETCIAVLENTEVIYNNNYGINKEYCDEHNIKSFEGKINSIGVGVVAKGSIVLTVKRKLLNGGEALSDKFAKALCGYLKNKGLSSVRQDNNDVLVDDFKVASGGEIMVGEWNYMGFQISVNQDIEAIENICIKKSLKKPKALSEYGITTEEMKEFCEQYWSNN